MFTSVRHSVKDVDVEAKVDPAAKDQDNGRPDCARSASAPETQCVFRARSQCRNPGKGRMLTRLLSARFSAHADPDSVWTSSLAFLSSSHFSAPRFVSLSTSSRCLVLDRSLLRGRCRDRDRKKVTKDMLDVIAIGQSEIRLQVQ